MRYLILITAFLFSLTALGQIKGNKNIISKSFEVDKINKIKINLYAKIVIDCSVENSLSIKTDSNLFEFIDKAVIDGVLHLNQKQWIEASKQINIAIGAPDLHAIETGTHDPIYINSFYNDSLNILAPIGNLKIKGATDYFKVESKNAKIDASELVTKSADIEITGRGKVTLDVVNDLMTKLSGNSNLKLMREPLSIKGGMTEFEKKPVIDNNIKWIKFTLKNNSIGSPKLFVIGPKKDGTTFSYGFAMMPLASRTEKWTIGTKIYSNSTFGKKKLLVTIAKSDEGNIVKLFE